MFEITTKETDTIQYNHIIVMLNILYFLLKIDTNSSKKISIPHHNRKVIFNTFKRHETLISFKLYFAAIRI